MRIFFIWMAICVSLFSEPSIVFIHLGKKIPDYLPIAIKQARLFNPTVPIYLLGNEAALKFTYFDRVHCVNVEDLPQSDEHRIFNRLSRLDKRSREGFWRYTTERFFYLYEWMKKENKADVFHLEYDNMLYADVSTFLPIFHQHYKNMLAVPFDNDGRGIASFIYVANVQPLEKLVEYITSNCRSSNNDMEFLAGFRKELRDWIDHLPIVMNEYDKPLISPHHHQVNDRFDYSKHVDLFESVFDAAAFGQYLGGIDPRNGKSEPGFVNESCVVNPSHFQFEWIEDGSYRKVPYMNYLGKKVRINNLHIHSKKLFDFYSK